MTDSVQSQPRDESAAGAASTGPARAAASLLLVLLVAGVFLPILNFDFVNLDVPGQVTRNSYIRGLSAENVKHILTSWCVTSYYPVRTLSYALDYQIWGLNPKGFKLTNIVIHTANVLLLFWLILRLLRRPSLADLHPTSRWDVTVAALAAAIVAVHPVVVEPVTWVSGREELLTLLGVLGCFHFHLTARWLEKDDPGSGRVLVWHIAAALSCAFACLSNAVAAVTPLLIAAWDLLMLGRGKWRRIVVTTSVLWVIAAATIVLKKMGDATNPTEPELAVLSLERLTVVLDVYRLNLQTLAWPSRLSIDYWNVAPGGFADPGVILGALAIALTCLLAWLLRRRVEVVFGLAWFGIALGPTSQIMPHHIDRADRFLYLPLAGLAVAVSMLLRPLGQGPRRRRAPLIVLVGILALLTLGLRSARQVHVWRNAVTLWEDCLQLIPNNAFAHACLADALANEGRFPEAIEHYEISLEVCPEDVQTLSDYAYRLATHRDEQYRDYGRAIAMAEQGCRISNWKDSRIRHTLAMAHMNLATTLNAAGQFQQAIDHYRSAIEADPDYETPLFNLAILLATCREETLRRPDEAVRLAEQACTLVEPLNPIQLWILASVYIETGQTEKAIAAIERAIPLAQDAGDRETVAQLQSRLESLRRAPEPLPTQSTPEPQ